MSDAITYQSPTGEMKMKIVKTRRFGYQYWKIQGHKTLFGTRREAEQHLILMRREKLNHPLEVRP